MRPDQARKALARIAKSGDLLAEPEALAAIRKIVASWASKAKPGKGSRDKGHGYERTVANYLKAIYPEAKRGLQGRGGFEAPDVDGTPLYIECKRKQKVAGVLGSYYRAQAESDGRPAVVVVREDGRPEVALVPLELLVGLLATPYPHDKRGNALELAIDRGHYCMNKHKEATP